MHFRLHNSSSQMLLQTK